jgi:hypothetical protein
MLIPDKKFSHIHLASTVRNNQSVNSVSEPDICNLMSFVKSLGDEDNHNTSIILHAQNVLENIIDSNSSDSTNDVDLEDQSICLIKFMIEELALMQRNKYVRKCSPELVKLCFLWHMTSHSLYMKLQDLFYLPSVRRLQQLSLDRSVRKLCRLELHQNTNQGIIWYGFDGCTDGS